MSTTTESRRRRPYSKADKAILIAQGVLVVVVGILAFASANDPDWGDLQRLVIVMLLGLWMAGLAAAAVLARFVENRWWRYAVLLVVPFVGIGVLILAANT